MEVNNIIDTILDMIYPQVCGICGKVARKSICNKCRIRLKNEFKFEKVDYSEDTEKNFKEHYYFFKYADLIRQQILDLKFHEKPYVGKTITYFLKENKKDLKILEKYDIITVVPVSIGRKKERVYNQSTILAKEISRIIERPFIENVLYKIKNTVPQSTLNKEQREQNAKGVYKVNSIQKIYDKKILIFDDIYTTGSTVNECAKVLGEHGIRKEQIGVMTIAKD